MDAISNKRAISLSPTHCNAHYSNFVFDPFGNVYSCLAVIGEKKHCIGYYNQNGINWKDEQKKKWHERTPTKRCDNCKLILLCGGGCFVKAMESSDTFCDSYYDRLKYVVKKIYVESINQLN